MAPAATMETQDEISQTQQTLLLSAFFDLESSTDNAMGSWLTALQPGW